MNEVVKICDYFNVAIQNWALPVKNRKQLEPRLVKNRVGLWSPPWRVGSGLSTPDLQPSDQTSPAAALLVLLLRLVHADQVTR